MSIRTILLLAALLTGCAAEPPATRQDVVLACGALNLATCEAFGRCLGWDAAEVHACVIKEDARCESDVSKENCFDIQRDALDRCAADVADDTCPELCGDDGFCFAPCFYRCP